MSQQSEANRGQRTVRGRQRSPYSLSSESGVTRTVTLTGTSQVAARRVFSFLAPPVL